MQELSKAIPIVMINNSVLLPKERNLLWTTLFTKNSHLILSAFSSSLLDETKADGYVVPQVVPSACVRTAPLSE